MCTPDMSSVAFAIRGRDVSHSFYGHWESISKFALICSNAEAVSLLDASHFNIAQECAFDMGSSHFKLQKNENGRTM